MAALLLLEQYDALGPVRDHAEKHLVAESHKHPITRVLESVPGIGEVRAAQVVSVVVTPDRFRTRAQFWSYSGLGIVMRSSSDWVQNAAGQVDARAGAADARPQSQPQPAAQAGVQGFGHASW